MDVGVLLQQLENTPGVVVLITNKVCTTKCVPPSKPGTVPLRVQLLLLYAC